MTHVKRRTFLAGAAAAGTAGIMALPEPSARANVAAASPKNLIVVTAIGGWDTTYSLDPKPDLPTVEVPPGELRSYEDITIWADDQTRPSLAGFFDRYAAQAAIVNGISVRSIAHPECRRRCLTGLQAGGSPDFGAIAAFELGKDLPMPYAIYGDQAYLGGLASIAGRAGLTNQIVALVDPAQAYPSAAGSPYAHAPYVPDEADEAAIRQFVVARAERERAVIGKAGYNKARIDDFVASLERGDVLRRNNGFGERGVTLSFQAQTDLAVLSLETDIAWAVNVDSGLSFDTHAQNAGQNPLQETLFAELTRLADELGSRPGKRTGSTMLDETVVAVVSEMTRTPLVNAEGGKDHWPVATMLLFGGGIAGGRSYGGTNDLMEPRPTNFATGATDGDDLRAIATGNVAAGILEAVGVDPSAYYPNEEPFSAICS